MVIKKVVLLLAVLGLSAGLAACSKSDGSGDSGSDGCSGSNSDFNSSLDIDLARMTVTDSGLCYEDLVEGTDPASDPDNVVTVAYTGLLPDGSEFDAGEITIHLESGRLIVPTGGGSVILGFSEGAIGIKLDGTRRVIIPPELGYGDVGIPGTIPPNSKIIFDIVVNAIY